eukprot:scpid96321/ scgid21774/ 
MANAPPVWLKCQDAGTKYGSSDEWIHTDGPRKGHLDLEKIVTGQGTSAHYVEFVRYESSSRFLIDETKKLWAELHTIVKNIIGKDPAKVNCEVFKGRLVRILTKVFREHHNLYVNGLNARPMTALAPHMTDFEPKLDQEILKDESSHGALWKECGIDPELTRTWQRKLFDELIVLAIRQCQIASKQLRKLNRCSICESQLCCVEKHHPEAFLLANSAYRVSGIGRSVEDVLEWPAGKLKTATRQAVTRYVFTPSRRRFQKDILSWKGYDKKLESPWLRILLVPEEEH